MMKDKLMGAALIAAWGISAMAGQFEDAKCVWIAGRTAETNLTVSFRRTFDVAAAADATLRISASAAYKASMNGRFVGWGPARTVYGYARIDEWKIPLKQGSNVLVVDVAGYGFESMQYNGGSPFLSAEIVANGRIVAATPDGFEAVEVPRRRDTPVYSRQRGFPAEEYAIDADWMSWCAGGDSSRPRLSLSEASAPKWLPRAVPYPDFAMNGGLKPATDAKGGAMWKLPSIDSGFIGLKFRCRRPGRIAVEFDEAIGTNGVIDLARNGDPLKSWHACYNRLVWDVKDAGEYAVETMEPYTVQFARVVVESGEFTDVQSGLRQVRNPRIRQAAFSCSDKELETMFAAAKETLAQNAVDILTDCPSRERVGWLCDTFFSSETTAWLTGDFSIEREYLLNFTRTDDYGAKVPKGAVPGFMPSRQGGLMPTYMMWYVIQCAAAAERLDVTERTAFVEAVRTRIEGIFGWLAGFEREGLLEDLPGWVFIEWSKANDYVKGVNFPANMLWAMALEQAGRAMGRSQWIVQAEMVRNKIRAFAYDGMFFHDQAQRGADGKLTLNQSAKTETCQYYAFFTSLVAPDSHPDLWRVVVDELGPRRRGHAEMDPSDAFIGFFLRLNILTRYGCGKELVADMKSYFGHMVAETGTFWEFNDGHDSRCHAIGGYVAVLMARAVFGIERIDWANRTIIQRSPSVALQSATCELPVRDGRIRLSVKGGCNRVSVMVPVGWQVTYK